MADAAFKDVPELFEVGYQSQCMTIELVFCWQLLRTSWERCSPRARKPWVCFVSGVHIGDSVRSFLWYKATFRELGPPDLCHVVKSTGRSGQKDVSTNSLDLALSGYWCPGAQLGSYHYVSGVDASSSASLAAYINSLTYSIDDNSTWFSKSTAWKVRSGCYWQVNLRLYFASVLSCPCFTNFNTGRSVVSMPSRAWICVWMSKYLEACWHMLLTFEGKGMQEFAVLEGMLGCS